MLFAVKEFDSIKKKRNTFTKRRKLLNSNGNKNAKIKGKWRPTQKSYFIMKFNNIEMKIVKIQKKQKYFVAKNLFFLFILLLYYFLFMLVFYFKITINIAKMKE